MQLSGLAELGRESQAMPSPCNRRARNGIAATAPRQQLRIAHCARGASSIGAKFRGIFIQKFEHSVDHLVRRFPATQGVTAAEV